ncbi:TlpA family protein disulfide reductase [Verrucomicrobiaceae bacterium N1E253]|uniref:TlpA family protein disulfide reductase n=1 Tax=Oceaniferula marina TaxID=2748318 RepID=A0A851GKP7_9BACT|nr:TlpA family protein disulfide reductase [Oceaniferula marina]
MLPHERSLVKELKGRPFAIVGVNSDSKEKLKQLVKDGTTTWRNFTNEQSYGKISTKWGVRGWPTLYLIDHNGVIKHKGLRGEEMEKAIKEMVAEAEAAKGS